VPLYAPRLHPDERVWKQTKYRDLATFLPQDVTDLGQAIQCPRKAIATLRPREP
jgi:transposase